MPWTTQYGCWFDSASHSAAAADEASCLVVTDGFPVGDTVSSQTVIERANAADVSVLCSDSYRRIRE